MRHTGEATCPNCQTTMNVELEEPMSGCSPEANLDTQPCHHDECRVKLCPNCDQFKCQRCDLAHCAEHAFTVDVPAWEIPGFGISSPACKEKWCPDCVQQAAEDAVKELAEAKR